MPSYHDLHITARKIERTSIFNLPFRVQVLCCRVSGWEVWAKGDGQYPEELLGAEYDRDKPLRLDVDGAVIVDSLSAVDAEIQSAVNTVNAWKDRKAANRSAPSEANVRQYIQHKWPDEESLTPSMVEEIVSRVMASV